MATIHFYEKRGCGNNTKQKNRLIEAGHTLILHDLLHYKWANEAEKLRSFFGNKPIVDWFNRAAPAIKNGVLNFAEIDAKQAIELMIEQPLLIRRPLLEIEDRRMAGFEANEIASFLGLITESSDLENCPKQHSAKVCHHE